MNGDERGPRFLMFLQKKKRAFLEKWERRKKGRKTGLSSTGGGRRPKKKKAPDRRGEKKVLQSPWLREEGKIRGDGTK